MSLNPVRSIAETFPIVIANGDTASEGLNLGGRIPCGLYIPTPWTSADLTFEVSPDGETFYSLEIDGGSYSVTAAAGTFVYLRPEYFFGARSLRVVSSAAQSAERTILIAGGKPQI